MKKSLLIFFFIGSAVIKSAQPTITASGVNPVIGDNLPMNTSNYVAPGNSGSSQTWDLSTMASSVATTYTAVATSSTPNGSSFPNSNIALSSGGGNYSYYKTSSSSFQNYGFYSGTTVMSYSNPEDFLRFPCTYNSTYSDTWAVTFVNTFTFYRTGSTTVTADGYGTLTTPAGTFSNVMRVHFVQNYQDSAYIPSYGTYLETYNNDEYMWYLNGNHFPIALVYTLTYSTGTSQGGSYMSNVVGVNEPSVLNSFTVFPNPVSSDLHFDINLKENQNIEIQLFNEIGSLVATPVSANANSGRNEYNVQVGDLTEGIYFARIILDGTLTSTRRFSVSR